jgi:MFS family permease
MSTAIECGATAQIPVVTRVRSRRTLPPMAAFAGTAFAYAGLYLAAGAPTPLLVQYQQQWSFPAGMLTIAFAAYAIALVVALVVAGSLSDFIGRRPVLIGALSVELAAMLLFVVAPNIEWVIVARVVQGVATGAATSAFTASLVELAPERHKKLGTIIGSTAPAGGLGLGALLTGIAVQFSATASVVVFTALAAIMVLGGLVAIFAKETVSRRSGATRSLIPRVSIPALARREFVAAIPVHLAAWMLAGLFMGLAPTILQSIFHLHSGLLDGATAFLEPAAAAAVGFVLGSLSARRTTIIGGAAVLVGTAIIVAGIALQSLPLLWLGGIIGGVGFGASFSGAMRSVAPLAEPHQRAELFAGVFLVAYLSFGIPSIVVGQLIGPLGLFATVLGYGAAILLAAAVGIVAQARLSRRPSARLATEE